MAEKNIKSNYTPPPRKNDSYKDKILLTVFLFLFVVFIISNFITNKGIFFDVPGCFLIGLFNKSPYFYFHDFTARFFSFVLATIPYNIFIPIIKSFNLLDKLNLFYISYLIMSGVLTALNFYIAKQYTKRYDIAIYALFVYSFFYLPGSIWAIREIFIAFPIWFILLQFFVCKKRLSKSAKIFFLFSLIYSFESFEIFAILGVILFIFSVLFAIKKDKRYKLKLTIGITSLIATIYIVIKTIFVATKAYNITVASLNWFYDLISSAQNLFSINFCISLFGIILIYLFINRKIKFLKFLLIIYSLSFIKNLNYLNLIKPDLVLGKDFYTLLFLIIPLFFIFVLRDEYLNRKFIKNKSLKTIFSVSLIIGIFQFIYLINGNIKFYSEYFIPLKNVLNTSNGIIKKDPALIFKDFNKYNLSCMIYLDSIFVQSANPDKKINTILLDENSDVYYEAKTDTIHFRKYDFGLKTKTKDFDFTPIRNQLIKKDKTIKLFFIFGKKYCLSNS